MTVKQIKDAVKDGKEVFWSSPNYLVIKDAVGQFLINSLCNDHCIGLTWADDITLNGKEEDFYIG